MKEYQNVVLLNESGLWAVDNLSSKLYEMLVSHRKVSRETFKVEDIAYLVGLANAINSCGQYEVSKDGLLFTDMVYPDVIKMLIHPNKVTLTSDLRARDLLDHVKCDDVVYDMEKVTHITERIYSSFKLSGKYVKVSELRAPKLLNDIKWTVRVNEIWQYNAEDTFNWLVPINSCVAEFYDASYFNEHTDYGLQRYISGWNDIQ